MNVAAIRRLLERRGDEVVNRMVEENLNRLCGSAEACRLGCFAAATLHRARIAGRIIAYRRNRHGRFVYPVEQFRSGGVEPWASDIVGVLGNGAAALHFLYVRRRSLGGESLAGILLRTEPRAASGLTRTYLRQLAAD